MEPVVIDGAFGEGGGQILRTSISLAALTGKPLQIYNIRAKRSKPGLHAQHLTSVRAAAALCNAALQGAEMGSQFLSFTPGPLSSDKEFRFEVGTAGAVCLVAQTALVPSLYLSADPVKIKIYGGTHVPMAPPTDYLEGVYLPVLRRMGAKIAFSSSVAGFMPKGGGEAEFSSGGDLTTPLNLLDRGKLVCIRVLITTSQLPEHVAERGETALMKDLKGYGVHVKVEKRDLKSAGPGAAVTIIAECEHGIGGFSTLGERGKPMERVAGDALKAFQKWFAADCAVDEHLADQLVLPCALIPYESVWKTSEVTEHLRTVLATVQQFLPIKYDLKTNADGSGIARVEGVDLKRSISRR